MASANKKKRSEGTKSRHLYDMYKCFFPIPRSGLRIWSRETGSAAPSRVSLLILTLVLNLVLSLISVFLPSEDIASRQAVSS